MCAKLGRSLSHPDEAKVPGLSACIEHHGSDPMSIVANSDVQRAVAVSDFGFDLLGARVPECVRQCFAGDQESLLPHDRMQVAATPCTLTRNPAWL